MRGISVKNGACFVEVDGITVKISRSGECELSPINFNTLEWDLRTEPPDEWDYLYAGDIEMLGENVIKDINDIVNKFKSVLDI